MMETRELRTRWQNHRQSLLRADYNQADEELAAALNFADSNPLISNVLTLLRSVTAYQSLDPADWLAKRRPADRLGAGRTNLGFSLDTTDRAAQCLRVLDWAIDQWRAGEDALRVIGRTTYVGRDSDFSTRVRSAVELIFDPFFNYVDAELRNRETLITPTDIIGDIQLLVDGSASILYSETHKLLTDAYRQLFTLSATSIGSSWYQVGYSCRQVLVRFANEVFDPSFVPQGEEQPKGDDARSKLQWTIRYALKRCEVGDRYRKAQEDLVDANWQFVNNAGHRQETTTEADAKLAVIYTYLTVWMVDNAMRLMAEPRAVV
jgi:hypothetical protein